MRIAVVSVSPTLLAELLRGNPSPGRYITSTLPTDARIIGIENWSHWRGTPVRVAFESETFDEVPEGAIPPAFEPVFTATLTDLGELVGYMNRERAEMEKEGSLK